jgi:Ala-tRNA(Pro) deacylase
MIKTETVLLEFLTENHLHYQRIEHEPVFTCEEAEKLRPKIDAVSTKNLFLCDKKARNFYLVVTNCNNNIDIKKLAVQLGVSKLRFASEENLSTLLGVGRGAVTVLGLVNDLKHRVALWIYAEIWKEQEYLCHPLVNTATLVLSKTTLEMFFNLTGHTIHFF